MWVLVVVGLVATPSPAPGQRPKGYHHHQEPKDDFIKTTYDISLDSQISLLPRGFSPLMLEWESREGRSNTAQNSFTTNHKTKDPTEPTQDH